MVEANRPFAILTILPPLTDSSSSKSFVVSLLEALIGVIPLFFVGPSHREALGGLLSSCGRGLIFSAIVYLSDGISEDRFDSHTQQRSFLIGASLFPNS